jgi:hypothetical protein
MSPATIPMTPVPQILPLSRHMGEALETLGWQVGPPPQITPETLRIDATNCKRRRCRNCGRRRLEFVPYNRNGRYRGVATCPDCLTAEEV